jgi:hypothetical protein
MLASDGDIGVDRVGFNFYEKFRCRFAAGAAEDDCQNKV